MDSLYFSANKNFKVISQDFSRQYSADRFSASTPRFIELAVFRFEEVCVRIQEGMEGYLRTAALERRAGIDATFRWLRRRGVRICLLTDFQREDFLLLLERLGWRVGEEELIQVVVLNQSAQENPVKLACESAGIGSAAHAITVVDTPKLLHAARSAGGKLVFGVTNGQSAYNELAKEPFFALLDGAIQLPNYLLSNLSGSMEESVTTVRPPRIWYPFMEG